MKLFLEITSMVTSKYLDFFILCHALRYMTSLILCYMKLYTKFFGCQVVR